MNLQKSRVYRKSEKEINMEKGGKKLDRKEKKKCSSIWGKIKGEDGKDVKHGTKIWQLSGQTVPWEIQRGKWLNQKKRGGS